MKKLFALILIITCFCIGFLANRADIIFADEFDEITITNVALVIKLGAADANKEGENYVAEYINETTVYYEHVVRSTITTEPYLYDTLNQDTKDAINALMVWKVNDEAIVLTDNNFENNEYKIKVVDKDLLFSPKLPGTYTVGCHIQSVSGSATLIAKYTTPKKVELVSSQSLNQLYENFETISFSTTLQPENFIDPSLSYTYSWKLNGNTVANHTLSTLDITLEMIKIGTFTILLEINELPLLSDTKTIKITTENDYVMTLTHSGGGLVQTLGENNPPIIFNASIPISTPYTVNWYLKTPLSSIYKKLTATGLSFTFAPLSYTHGEYKIFAQSVIQSQTVTSEVYTIMLNAKVINPAEKIYDIIASKRDNSRTNVQAFECTIELESSYDENLIVWYVNNSPVSIGKVFLFEPTLAGNYHVQAKLLNENGTINAQQLTNAITIKAEALQTSQIYIYLSIAMGALILVFIGVIIISNKMREKIW